jgi:hypothetical protein
MAAELRDRAVAPRETGEQPLKVDRAQRVDLVARLGRDVVTQATLGLRDSFRGELVRTGATGHAGNPAARVAVRLDGD